MMLDSLRYSSLYETLSPGLRQALAFLRKPEAATLAPGRYELDGSRVYAMVQTYESKPRDKGRWEAHRRYLDVQYLVSGIEQMGYAPLDALTVVQPYQEEKDCLFLEGPGDWVTVPAGHFAVFFPHDAHMPGLACPTPAPVRKIVVKVLVGA